LAAEIEPLFRGGLITIKFDCITFVVKLFYKSAGQSPIITTFLPQSMGQLLCYIRYSMTQVVNSYSVISIN